jgi:NADP-reducing hydrogenase subunit HndB
MAKLTPADIDRIKNEAKSKPKNWIKVGMSTCGVAAGADEVFAVFSEEVKKRNLQVEVKKCGCLGMCYAEPLVEVNIEGSPAVIYGRVNKEVAMKIMEKHVCDKMLVNDYVVELELKDQSA